MARHLAIGDIHGCYQELRTLCDFVEIADDDVIITLGDYADRGPNSNAVIDWLIHRSRTHNLKPVRGNHDLMMLNARDSEAAYRYWMQGGGDATLRSYAPVEGDPGRLEDIPEQHWRFLADELLPYYEIETHFFVHGSVYPDIPLADQPDFMLYWKKFDAPPRHQSGKLMVCGHTSQKSGLPIANQHAVCIDTWAFGGGWLSCLEVESGQIWQVNRQGKTRILWLDECRQ